MRISSRLAAPFGALLLLSGSAAGQDQGAGDGRPAYTTRVTAILVDAVVRDKQGKPVLDLTADDFEIYEDGVRQDIASFTLVSKGAGVGIGVKMRRPGAEQTAVVQPTGAPTVPETFPSVVALVFDALSPESLAICQNAALRHVGMMGETDARIGIFETEPSVRMIQGFTSDPARLRAAIRQLRSGGMEAKLARDERLDALRTRQAQLRSTEIDPSAQGNIGQGVGDNVPQFGQAEVQRQLMASEMRLLRAFDSMDRDHRGYAATSAIQAVLDAMQFLPGRKSLLFFSEGLPASPVLQAELQTVIEAANRSNITIYTVDATGLRVQSVNTETLKEVQALGEARLRQITMPDQFADEPLTRGLERTEDLMRYSGEAGLSKLAEDTGGFLVRDTNDIGSAFKRIDEDMRFHYLLTYAPKNDALDGKFRSVDVRVKRKNLSVFARKGYRAGRALPLTSEPAYEAPALALLDAGRLPNAFPSQARAFAFPETDRPGLAPIVVRVPTSSLQFDIDKERSMYSAQVAVVVRIRDADGRAVQKLSQQYVLTGDAGDVDGARKGEILFYREPELKPGSYQVESIVYDAVAEKGSARVATLVVPDPDVARVRMSSIVLVSRTERTTGQEENRPFYYGDTLLYPNLGEALDRERDRQLAFYFVVYQPNGRQVRNAHIALLRNGQTIADATRDLPATGETRLPQVGTLPISDLPPGTYELRVTVNDGRDQDTKSTFFTLS